MDDKLAGDLAAMWQSELAAMAADRELREFFIAMLAFWAATASLSPRLPQPADEYPPGGASPAQPARPAPADSASHFGLDEIERLARRVAELEQRLAKFERDEPGDA